MRNFGRPSYGFLENIPILLGSPGATVSCADLRAAQEGLPPGNYESYTPPADDDLSSRAADYLDETFGITKKRPPKIPVVAYGLVFGILGLGVYTFYTAYQNRRS